MAPSASLRSRPLLVARRGLTLNLAILVVFVLAAWRPSPERVRLAAIIAIVWGLPHLLYHSVNTEGLGASDVVANLGGLAIFVALPLTVLVGPPD